MIAKSLQWIKDKISGKPTKTAQGKGRSPQWPKARKAHLETEPKCAWCGSTKSLEVHHIRPFHLHPELELDPSNLITLCESDEKCHLSKGHLGSWKQENPDIRIQCNSHKSA